MTSELRPAVEVADEVWDLLQNEGADEDAIGVIEDDREAVRAEVVREIVAWLREQDGHGYDDMRANCIEVGEYLK